MPLSAFQKSVVRVLSPFRNEYHDVELGALFVDSVENPIEADQKRIELGEANAVNIKDFAIMPKIVET